MVHLSVDALVDWSIGPLVECQMSYVKFQMSNVKNQMSIRLNFCRGVPPEFLQSFLGKVLRLACFLRMLCCTYLPSKWWFDKFSQIGPEIKCPRVPIWWGYLGNVIIEAASLRWLVSYHRILPHLVDVQKSNKLFHICFLNLNETIAIRVSMHDRYLIEGRVEYLTFNKEVTELFQKRLRMVW